MLIFVLNLDFQIDIDFNVMNLVIFDMNYWLYFQKWQNYNCYFIF